MDGSYSLSDIAAATGNDGMMGGGSWWVVLLFLVLFGANGFGGAGRQAATTDELSAGFNFSGVNNKLDAIAASVATEGRTTDNAICTLGYQTLEQTSALSKQIAECCCATQQAVHAEGEATRAMIRENEIQTLRDQVQGLQLSQALCGVPKVSPYGYGMYPTFGCGYNAGCTTI